MDESHNGHEAEDKIFSSLVPPKGNYPFAVLVEEDARAQSTKFLDHFHLSLPGLVAHLASPIGGLPPYFLLKVVTFLLPSKWRPR